MLRFVSTWHMPLQLLGKKAEAAERYRQALELDQRHPDAWNNLGTLLAQMGEPAEACTAFERALTIDAGDPRDTTWLTRSKRWGCIPKPSGIGGRTCSRIPKAHAAFTLAVAYPDPDEPGATPACSDCSSLPPAHPALVLPSPGHTQLNFPHTLRLRKDI